MPDNYSQTSAEIKRIRSLASPKPKVAVAPPPKKKRDLAFLNKLSGIKKPEPPRLSIFGAYTPRPKDPTIYEEPEMIAKKLNSLFGAIKPHVIDGYVTVEDVIKALKELRGDQRLDISNIKNGEHLSRAAQRNNFDMNDQRWHGGGSSSTTIFYSDAVSGVIDGVNKTFTVPNTITTALSLFLANSIYQPVVDFTTSGTTITMAVAPDASLSGQPFWLSHT